MREVLFALVATLSLFCFPAPAQDSPGEKVDRLPPPTSPYLLLIRDPVVQKLVAMNDDQKKAIRRLTDTLDAPLWQIRALPAAENAVQLDRLITAARGAVQQILSPKQIERFEQIVLRAQGAKSLLRDDVAKWLALSADQRQQIEQSFHNLNEAAASLAKETRQDESREQILARARQLQEEQRNELIGILDQTQRQGWLDLLGDPIDTSRLGAIHFKAPELISDDGWIGSKPLRLEDLHGKVVALHFWTHGCSNCIHNYPWYRGWVDDYSDRGLVVVGIHTPETQSEYVVENVRRSAEENNLRFPILIDNQKKNWQAWGNTIWPAVYLIDKHGYVRAWWFGELNWQGAKGNETMRATIEELLKE